MQKYLLYILFLVFCGSGSLFSKDTSDSHKSKFDPARTILNHIKDAHDFHVMDIGGHAVSLPLPVILYTDKGLVTFMSSEFHHDNEGKYVVESNDVRFVKYNEKIYYASENSNDKDQFLEYDEKGEVSNDRPIDISITKNVFSMFLSVVFLLVIFLFISRTYKKINIDKSPRGLSAFMEPIIMFVVNDVAKPNIGKKYMKYVPFLLTLFFFILMNNVIGLIPIFPFSSNLTGNISFTFAMAVFTLLLTLFSGNKNYWTHIFAMPGVPLWLLPIMIPIELIGVLTKPFALMVRLFANITAGHIVILSLVSLIFILKTIYVSPASVIFLLFMNILELLVSFIQAYIFTMLSSMFIGQALEDSH